MKLLKNIPGGFKLFRSVRVFNRAMKEIEEVRNSGDTEKEKQLIGDYVTRWIHNLIDIFDITITVEGAENIPKDDGFVFISNHQGYADIIVILHMMEGLSLIHI